MFGSLREEVLKFQGRCLEEFLTKKTERGGRGGSEVLGRRYLSNISICRVSHTVEECLEVSGRGC